MYAQAFYSGKHVCMYGQFRIFRIPFTADEVSPERHVDHTADSGMCGIRNCRPARLRFLLSRKSNVETERPGHLQREVVLTLGSRMVKGYKKGVTNSMKSSERPVLLKQLEPHLTKCNSPLLASSLPLLPSLLVSVLHPLAQTPRS